MIPSMEPEVEEIDALMAQFLDEDEGRRYKAAFALQKTGRPVLPLALKAVINPNALLREMGCCVLGGLQDETADQSDPTAPVLLRDGVPVLLHLLRADEDPDVRSAAAAALSHQTVPEAIPHLCAAAKDPHEEVRYDVTCALGGYYGHLWEDADYLPYRTHVIRTLIELMDDPDDDVRDWATFGIHQGGHDTPETRTRLFQALGDLRCDVRGEAAEGLALFGETGLKPHLELLLYEDPEISPCYFAAAAALGDPSLLPAVEYAAERWRATLEEHEGMHHYITSALETLRAKAAEHCS